MIAGPYSSQVDYVPGLPRFAVAKFVPDPLRNEPINVGLIFASDGAVVARFLGEQENSPGRVSNRLSKIPDRDQRRAYSQWVAFWRLLIEKNKNRQTTDELFETLFRASKRQFSIVNGGQLRKVVLSTQVDDAVDELFSSIVAEEKASKALDNSTAARLLRTEVSRLFKATGFSERKDYFSNYGVSCPIPGTSERLGFFFDYAIHRTRPVSLLQRVLLTRSQSLATAMFMFQSAQSGLSIPKERCASLVYVDSTMMGDKEVRAGLGVVSSNSQVVNVVDIGDAERKLLFLAAA